MKNKLLMSVVVLGVLAAAAPATPGERVSSVLKGMKVGAPVRHDNLTVFPLTGMQTGTRTYVTLDKAIRQGWVEVQEKEGGNVNAVRVRNKSDKHVFGMAGEIITGAKQNRMLQKDVLLNPKSGWLDLSVYCVEHGRWSGASMEFSSKGQIAAGRVRGNAANFQSQGEVWAEVSRSNAELGIKSSTDRFDAVFDDEGVQEKVEAYQDKLEHKVPQLAPDVHGVAVAVGDKLVCVDVFSSSAMFKQMWPRLLESYVVDAISQTLSGSMTQDEVRAMLNQAAGATVTHQPTVGAGQLVRIEGSQVAGSALVSGNQVVHLDLFPSAEVDDSPLRLDIRRNALDR